MYIWCLQDKIIPPDAITPEEEASTLKRLTQIIEYRLVTSDIPRAFKQLTACMLTLLHASIIRKYIVWCG